MFPWCLVAFRPVFGDFEWPEITHPITALWIYVVHLPTIGTVFIPIFGTLDFVPTRILSPFAFGLIWYRCTLGEYGVKFVLCIALLNHGKFRVWLYIMLQTTWVLSTIRLLGTDLLGGPPGRHPRRDCGHPCPGPKQVDCHHPERLQALPPGGPGAASVS